MVGGSEATLSAMANSWQKMRSGGFDDVRTLSLYASGRWCKILLNQFLVYVSLHYVTGGDILFMLDQALGLGQGNIVACAYAKLN